MLDGIKKSKGRLKGIAVLRPGISERELHGLRDTGVVGVRFNLVDFDPAGLARSGAENLLGAIRELDWFVEIQCNAADFINIEPRLGAVALLHKFIRFVFGKPMLNHDYENQN